MNYQELQEKAKDLGLKHVGVGKDELEKSIAAEEEKQLEMGRKVEEEIEEVSEKDKGKKQIARGVETAKQIGSEAGTTILKELKKAADVYFVIIGNSAHFMMEAVSEGSSKIESAVKIGGLKCSLPALRNKIRKIYTEIGGEVCVLDEEGLRDISIEKGQMKKLITRVRKYEKKIKKVEASLLELQSGKGKP